MQARLEFVGLVLQAAGPASVRGAYDVQGIRGNPRLYVAMTMGDTDQNKDEVDRTKAAINVPMRFQAFPFKGGHMWAPKEVIEPALTWVKPRPGCSHEKAFPGEKEGCSCKNAERPRAISGSA